MRAADLVWIVSLSLLATACANPRPSPGPANLENGSFHAQLNGFDIHYEVHGQGPPLMVVPNSWGLTLDGLRALFRPLERQRTLVYFDPRGMGASGEIVEPADMGPDAVRTDFDALRRHLGLEQVSAIGWSNGAYNLVLLAAEYPQTLDRVIFVHGGSSFGPEDGKAMMERHGELFRRMRETVQATASDTALSDEQRDARTKQMNIELLFPAMFADPQQAAVLPELYADVGFSFDHAMYTQQAWPTFDARAQLAGITASALVIAGAHDLLPPERVRELHDGLADSRFELFEDSGHFAPIEEPQRFQQVVLEFLGPA